MPGVSDLNQKNNYIRKANYEVVDLQISRLESRLQSRQIHQVRKAGAVIYCFWGFASRKSFTIETIVDMRFISVTCVVAGKIANLDAERGCISP